MKWLVEHYHKPILGLSLEDAAIDAADEKYKTVYHIQAESSFEAAVIAHGLYNGYSLAQVKDTNMNVSRTLHEHLADTISKARFPNHTQISADKIIYYYDNGSGHWIVVQREV